MSLFWIFLSTVWAGLLVLILHDATKDDSDGGAVRLAGKKVRMALNTMARGIRSTQKVLGQRTSRQKSASSPTGGVHAQSRPSSSDPIRGPSLIKQVLGATPYRSSRQKSGRAALSISELESAITEAVRKTAPECETFHGVIVEKKPSRSRRDPNWRLRGAKFGRADRKRANEALAMIVERMQQDVSVKDG